MSDDMTKQRSAEDTRVKGLDSRPKMELIEDALLKHVTGGTDLCGTDYCAGGACYHNTCFDGTCWGDGGPGYDHKNRQ